MELEELKLRGVRNAEGQIVRYSADDVEKVAIAYFLCGTVKATIEFFQSQQGIRLGHSTISKWMDREEWITATARIKKVHNDTLDTRMSSIISKAFSAVEDRMENGDVVIVKGEMMRKPVSMRDLAWTAAVLFDKRQIARKLPTRISGGESSDDKLAQIAAKLGQIAEMGQRRPTDITPDDNRTAGGHAPQPPQRPLPTPANAGVQPQPRVDISDAVFTPVDED